MKEKYVLPNADAESVNRVLKNPITNQPIQRLQCVEACTGCDKLFEDSNLGDVCVAYYNPSERQRLGCALQSNRELTKEEVKKINPLKASKRKKKGK